MDRRMADELNRDRPFRTKLELCERENSVLRTELNRLKTKPKSPEYSVAKGGRKRKNHKKSVRKNHKKSVRKI
jgi:hypothetical protein